MNKEYLFALATTLLPLLAGCAEDNIGVYGLNVEIRDARTGVPAAYGATMIVRSGAYVDTVRGWNMIPPEEKARGAFLPSAFQRTGTFEVTVLHPEYEVWQRGGVQVGASGSKSPVDNNPFPKTTHVLAELQPRDGS